MEYDIYPYTSGFLGKRSWVQFKKKRTFLSTLNDAFIIWHPSLGKAFKRLDSIQSGQPMKCVN